MGSAFYFCKKGFSSSDECRQGRYVTLVPHRRRGHVGLERQVSPHIPGAGRHWASSGHCGHVGMLTSSRVSRWTRGSQQA